LPIPTRADHQLSEIDDLHNSVIVRLRIWLHAGPDRNPKNIREALKEYVAKVTDFVNGGYN
jgi:hypothetical protein